MHVKPETPEVLVIRFPIHSTMHPWSAAHIVSTRYSRDCVHVTQCVINGYQHFLNHASGNDFKIAMLVCFSVFSPLGYRYLKTPCDFLSSAINRSNVNLPTILVYVKIPRKVLTLPSTSLTGCICALVLLLYSDFIASAWMKITINSKAFKVCFDSLF